MHKHVGLVVSVVLAGILFLVPGVADKLFALLFIGLVPFTGYTLPASAMLAFYALLLAVCIYAIARQFMTATNAVKRDNKARERARKKVLQTTAHAHPKTKPSHSKKRYLPVTEN